MRPALETLEQIEKYLNNALSADEKKAFEAKMQQDTELATQVEQQRNVQKGIERYGAKQSIIKAGKKYQIFKMLKVISVSAIVVIASIFGYTYFNNHKTEKQHTSENANLFSTETASRFIKPAFEDVDIPFKEFIISAEKGDTIFYESGTIILFPPNSFLDKNGKVISGDVKITYRELSDPIDFFMSGIPMDYDSNGVSYTFESAGMMEMYGYQNNETIFINPNAKPEINLASKTTDNAHSLYYLDTVQRKWIGKGKDEISVINENTELDIEINENWTNEDGQDSIDFTRSFSSKSKLPPLPKMPVKPNKASGELPVFSIAIEPGSVPELSAYDNLLFEVDKDEKNYSVKHAETEWEDVSIANTEQSGKYWVTFVKGKRKVTYLTRPVFEGKDYDEAIKLFKQKEKEYNKKLTSRLDKEQKQKEVLAQKQLALDKKNLRQQKENERIEKLNQLRAAQNSIIEKANKKYEAQNAEILAYRKAMERKKRIYVLVTLIEANDSKVSQYDKEDLAEAITIVEQRAEVKRQQAEAEKRIEKLAFEEGGNNMSNEVLRTFQMEQFGIWNCDNPLLQQGFPVAVNFKDKQGNDLDFINLTTIIKAFNGVFQNFQSKTIKLYNSDIMLFGVKGNQFVYLTYEDYKKCNITPQTTAYTFTMNIYPDKITSKADIKRILNL